MITFVQILDIAPVGDPDAVYRTTLAPVTFDTVEDAARFLADRTADVLREDPDEDHGQWLLDFVYYGHGEESFDGYVWTPVYAHAPGTPVGVYAAVWDRYLDLTADDDDN